jgi:Enoyl-CoA hydratase/isomerase
MIGQHRDGDVAVIEIDRHDRRNALDAAHCDGLGAAVREQAAGGARALVITGAGSSFCSGADLGGVYGETFRDALYAMLAAITGTRVPVIAAVNGPAIGAGAQVALACDLRVAAPAAVPGPVRRPASTLRARFPASSVRTDEGARPGLVPARRQHGREPFLGPVKLGRDVLLGLGAERGVGEADDLPQDRDQRGVLPGQLG